MAWALGRVPSAVTALAVAQSALETGRWKSTHCWNVGNIKAGPTHEGNYTCFRCNEVIGGKIKWFDPTSDGHTVPPGHPQTRFRAYANIYDGCLSYVEFLQRPRYAAAWEAMHSGNAQAFVRALKQAGYFTADEAPYAKAIVSLQKEFLAVLENRPAPALPVDHELQRLLVQSEEQWFALDHFGPDDFTDRDTKPDRTPIA